MSGTKQGPTSRVEDRVSFALGLDYRLHVWGRRGGLPLFSVYYSLTYFEAPDKSRRIESMQWKRGRSLGIAAWQDYE